jgi:hypothetical protein
MKQTRTHNESELHERRVYNKLQIGNKIDVNRTPPPPHTPGAGRAGESIGATKYRIY